jgi:hypothetical protein
VRPAAAQAPDVPIETRLKAAVVSKLPQFVDWPASALAAKPTVDLCVAGEDAFAVQLRDLEAGETVNGRPVQVRTVSRNTELAGCHLLVIAPGAGRGDRQMLLTAAVARPLLTVGDDPHFLRDGGIVQLRLRDGRVSFDINDGLARQVGLRISSHLLRLAASVERGRS